jgi:hypothetical protein
VLDQFLNELSLRYVRPTRRDAHAAMNEFVTVARAVASRGFARTVRTHRGVWGELLSEGYTVSQWLNDAEVDRDKRNFIRTVATKAPYIEDALLGREAEAEQYCECTLDGTHGLGITGAFLFDAPLVSIGGDPRFAQASLRVRVVEFAVEGDPVESEATVESISSVAHVEQRANWLDARIAAELRDGQTVLAHAPDVLPSLRFGERARGQLVKMTGTEPYFTQVVRHLRVLSSAAAAWADGPFEAGGITFSEESKATLRHGSYGPMRVFPCSDGTSRQFSKHSKPTGGNIRIYFLPRVEGAMLLEVGYVGPHLPIVSG